MQVLLGPMAYAKSLATTTQDCPPAMVLKRAPPRGSLHIAGVHVVSFQSWTLDMPTGIMTQVRHKHMCSPLHHQKERLHRLGHHDWSLGPAQGIHHDATLCPIPVAICLADS